MGAVSVDLGTVRQPRTQAWRPFMWALGGYLLDSGAVRILAGC